MEGLTVLTEHIVGLILPEIIGAIELVGIFVISVGAVKAFYHYIIVFFNKKSFAVNFELASAMATGLEFKMAAEILKTVQIRELYELVILGCVILLRALLSFLIHIEMKNGESTKAE